MRFVSPLQADAAAALGALAGASPDASARTRTAARELLGLLLKQYRVRIEVAADVSRAARVITSWVRRDG